MFSSNTSYEFVCNNYRDFMLSDGELKAVVIGGSVSRGYANKGCDIDILYFDQSVKYYQKRFATVENVKMELHYIPIAIFELLYSYVQPFMVDACPVDYSRIDYSVWGEKKCPQVVKSNTALNGILSAWRELKKLLDGIVVYDCENWYAGVKTEYYLIPDETKIKLIINEVLEGSIDSINKVINIMKLYMMLKGDVYSKVYWTDYYLENQLVDIKIYVENVFLPVPLEIDQWILATQRRFELLKEKHTNKKCSFCDGEILKCNIGRCANDFISDAIRAQENGLKIGCLLSLKRANEYIDRLAVLDEAVLPNMDEKYVQYWYGREEKATSTIKDIYMGLLGEEEIC